MGEYDIPIIASVVTIVVFLGSVGIWLFTRWIRARRRSSDEEDDDVYEDEGEDSVRSAVIPMQQGKPQRTNPVSKHDSRAQETVASSSAATRPIRDSKGYTMEASLERPRSLRASRSSSQSQSHSRRSPNVAAHSRDSHEPSPASTRPRTTSPSPRHTHRARRSATPTGPSPTAAGSNLRAYSHSPSDRYPNEQPSRTAFSSSPSPPPPTTAPPKYDQALAMPSS